jgi:hypothetical protein
MPPHCDALDGPVVKAARRALESGNPDLILAYVPAASAGALTEAFRKTVEARKSGGAAQEVADTYFFETAVRLHRAGEGAAFTGLKPAGLDFGPVIPVAERAIETGSPQELARLLGKTVEDEVLRRYDQLTHLRERAGAGLDEAREYTSAMLGLQVYANTIYKCAQADLHESHKRGEHED